MAIEIGGVTLNDHMIWDDQYEYANVAQNSLRTLGGNIQVYSQQLNKGQPITLLATTDQGWLTSQQVQDMQALADVAGATYTLTIGSNSFSVMFRHEDAPAFSAAQLDQIGAQAPAGYYTATIKFLTV